MGTLGKLKTKLYEMEWTIRNFDSLSVEEESPFFPSKEAAWHMTIAPNGMREHNSVGYVGLYLIRIARNRFSNLQVSFAIKTVDGKKYQETPYETLLCGKDCQIYGVPCFLPRAELFERKSELLPSNVLTILCTMKYSEPNEVPGKFYFFFLLKISNLRPLHTSPEPPIYSAEENEEPNALFFFFHRFVLPNSISQTI